MNEPKSRDRRRSANPGQNKVESRRKLWAFLSLLLFLFVSLPMAQAAPATPTSTSPGSTSSPGPVQSSSTVTLSWGASTGATSYELAVRDIASGSLVIDTTTSFTSYSASLSAGKTYRWDVAAINSTGESSFTTALYFQTPSAVTIPASPTGLSPGSSSNPGPTQSGSSVTLSWNASTGATTYEVAVVDVATGSFVVDTTPSSTRYTANLTAGKVYRWKVAAGNSAGQSSFTTPALYFQTPSAVTTPASPTGLSPGSSSNPGPTQSGSSVTLSWNASTGATTYEVAVVDVATGSFVVDTTTSSTSYTANLTAGKVYRWNVAAGNSAGQSSFTTPALYFQTPSATNTKPTVSLTSPIGGESWAVGTAHNITATITGSVTGWILEVSTDSGQTWATITTTNVASAGIIFAWTVPNTVTTNARVRATVTYSGGSAQSSSAADFSITAALSSGFTNGMRVMAQQGGIYVRDPQLNRLGSTAFAYDQSGGAHGTIVGTPIQGSADGNTGPWWYFNFDAGWNGYFAQSVIAAAPLAGDVPKPSLTSNAYASLNPFWRGGYAPASVPQPPSVANQLGGALGNCTWYAYGRALELGADATALQAVALGNAYQWAANSAPDNSPVPGAIAVKGADSNFPLGHVAVVESVNAGGSITVTESSATTNSQSPWYFLWRHRTLFSNDPVWGWSSSATTNGFRFIHLATSAPVQYTVTPSVTTAAGGTISPVSAEKVASGGSVNFTASAAAGYSVGQWQIGRAHV